MLLCLDINKRLINYIYISDGTTDGTKVYIDKVIEKALINKAKFVIIGHNHPSGNREMSNADYVATTAIIRSLEPLGIKFWTTLLFVIKIGRIILALPRKNILV